MKCRVGNAAQLALEAIRHQDLLRKFPTACVPALRLALVRVIKLKLPRAVQRLPIGPRHIRSRMFLARNISSQQAMSEKNRYNSLQCDAMENDGYWHHHDSSPLALLKGVSRIVRVLRGNDVATWVRSEPGYWTGFSLT